jgi:hypothetical protein
MGDTAAKRRARGILSDRLISYYETLMDAARHDGDDRLNRLIRQVSERHRDFSRAQHVAAPRS